MHVYVCVSVPSIQYKRLEYHTAMYNAYAYVELIARHGWLSSRRQTIAFFLVGWGNTLIRIVTQHNHNRTGLTSNMINADTSLWFFEHT